MGELRQDQQALREQLNKLLEELRKRGFPQPGQQPASRASRAARWISSAAPATRWATPRASSATAMPTARSTRRAARSRRCAAARRAWRSRCSSRWGRVRVPASRAAPASARANQETDPLGRPLRGRDYGDDTTVKVPGEIDVQRARRILEELRRRFGESFRPQLELDYIERLLKDY